MSFLNFWYMWRSEYVHTKEGLPKRSIEKDYRVRARSLKFETYNLEFKRFFLFSSFYFKYKRIRYHENQLENDRWWYRCDITKIWWYRCILRMFNKQKRNVIAKVNKKMVPQQIKGLKMTQFPVNSNIVITGHKLQG